MTIKKRTVRKKVYWCASLNEKFLPLGRNVPFLFSTKKSCESWLEYRQKDDGAITVPVHIIPIPNKKRR